MDEGSVEVTQVTMYAIPWWVIVAVLALVAIAVVLYRRGHRG